MTKILILLALVILAPVSQAHELKEPKVTKFWQNEFYDKELLWIIADTIHTEEYRNLSCAGFDADGVPLFQTLLQAQPLATRGKISNSGGWNNADVVEIRCVYR